MADKSRQIAFMILRDVEEKKAYSNLALISSVRKYRPSNVPFVRELVYGTIRNAMYLDYIISNFVKTPIASLKISDRLILRMGLYQLIFMYSVPDYAAVNESVQLAKRYSRGHESFINGVLRQYLRDKEYVTLPDRSKDEVEYLSIKYSFNKWIVETWINQFGEEEAEKLMQSLNETPRLCLRTNTLKISREDLASRLLDNGYEVEIDSDFDDLLFVKGEKIVSGNLFESGMFSIMDKGSYTVSKSLGAKEGDTIVDACAAPGGKTTAMATDMHDTGKIFALDIYKRRVSLIDDEAKRLGLTIIETSCWDSTRIDSELIDIADKVLVDAPCSGLGAVRRKPEIKYKEYDEELENLPEKQLDILKASSNYVKSGGILVYSTCTIDRRENENVVKAFLKSNRHFEVVERIQLLPSVDGTDGFFICKMKRAERLI